MIVTDRKIGRDDYPKSALGAAGGTKLISNIDEDVLGGLNTGYPAIRDVARVHVPRIAGTKRPVAVINGRGRINIVDNLDRLSKCLNRRS